MKWEKVKLREVTTIVGGYAFKSTNMKDECLPNYRPVVKIGNVSVSGKLDLSSVQYHEFSRDLEQYSIKIGDVLIAMTGATVGKVSVSTHNDLLLNQRVGLIRPKKELISHRFLHHSICNPLFYEYCQFTAGGGAQGNISPSQILDYQVPLPPLHIQEQIADTLDKADALRRKDQELLQKYDQLAQAIFYDMFGELTSNKFGWQINELKDVVNPETVVTYGIVQAGPNVENGIPYIKTGDIKNGEISKYLSCTSPDIAKKFKRSEVNEGDIVISIRATVGTMAVVPFELNGANLTQGTAKITPGARMSTEFLYYYIKSESVQEWIQRQVKGATFREITLDKLRKMPIMTPDIRRVKQFSEIIKNIKKQYSTCNSDVKKSGYIFNSLMTEYFS
jgi:type I restriction enzyme, S subunit